MSNRSTYAKAFVTAACALAIALLAIGAGGTRASPAYPDGTAATAFDITAMARHHPIEFTSPRYLKGPDTQFTRVAAGCQTKGGICGTDDNLCCSKQCTDCLENPHRCYCAGGEPPRLTAVLESFTGDVSYRENEGEWKDAVKGQKLHVNGDIHTGPDSEAIVRFSDGSELIVRQLTETAIGDGSGAANQPKIRMLLKMGEVAAEVNHGVSRPADFAIRTPNQTASVRGTVFVVSHDPKEGISYTTVHQGEVLVTPKNTSLRPLLLRARQRAWVSMEGVGPIEHVPIP